MSLTAIKSNVDWVWNHAAGSANCVKNFWSSRSVETREACKAMIISALITISYTSSALLLKNFDGSVIGLGMSLACSSFATEVLVREFKWIISEELGQFARLYRHFI